LTASTEEILDRSRTIAVVGMSAHEGRAPHDVPMAMARFGYTVVPVNPTVTEIDGLRAYPSLAEVPVPVDFVDVFRPADEAPEITRQSVAIGAGAVWLQLGLRSEEARLIAEEAGIDYVEDHCMAVERARFGIDKRETRG
jgi:predicted CoA-binding protein